MLCTCAGTWRALDPCALTLKPHLALSHFPQAAGIPPQRETQESGLAAMISAPPRALVGESQYGCLLGHSSRDRSHSSPNHCRANITDSRYASPPSTKFGTSRQRPDLTTTSLSGGPAMYTQRALGRCTRSICSTDCFRPSCLLRS